MSRQLFAWQKDGKYYLSAFHEDMKHVNGQLPAKEYDNKEALEQEAARRGVELKWR